VAVGRGLVGYVLRLASGLLTHALMEGCCTARSGHWVRARALAAVVSCGSVSVMAL
jgi:hypothetical protein